MQRSWLTALVLVSVSLPTPLLAQSSIGGGSFRVGAVGPDACRPGQVCLSGDVDGDGDDDLVSFAASSGPISVSLSRRTHFLPPVTWLNGACRTGRCELVDVTRDGRADLVWFHPASSTQVYVYESDPSRGQFRYRGLVRPTHCPSVDRCRMQDVDGDGLADVIGIDPTRGDVSVAYGTSVLAFRAPRIEHVGLCRGDTQCHLLDADRNGVVDVVRIARGGSTDGHVYVDTLGARSGRLVLSRFCAGATCAAGDFDGDGHLDLVALGSSVSVALGTPEPPYFVRNGAWLSRPAIAGATLGDFDGDGRTDLLESNELVVVGRATAQVDALTWQYTLSRDRTERARWRAVDARLAALAESIAEASGRGPTLGDLSPALPDLSPRLPSLPPSSPTPARPSLASSAFDLGVRDPVGVDLAAYDAAQQASLHDAIVDELEAILAEVPSDDAMNERDVTSVYRTLGKGAVALAALQSGAGLGLDMRGGRRCGAGFFVDWLVVDDEGRVSPWVGGAPRFFDRLGDDDVKAKEATIRALADVAESIRCLGANEIARLEQAWAVSVTSLVLRLADDGKRVAARALWDATTPITLLLFDAAKYLYRPATMELLRFPASLELADLGAADVLAEPRAYEETLAHALYCEAEAGVLASFGLWLDDLFHGGVINQLPMRAIKGRGFGTVCGFLEQATDRLRLGEGDCSLLEMASVGAGFCRSRRSCQQLGPNEDRFGESEAEGDGFSLPSPGMPGSSYTHFGLLRSELGRIPCSGGGEGGAVPELCSAIGTGSLRGRFSTNPEEDLAMRCALDVAGLAPGLSPQIERSANLPAQCMLGEDPPETPPPPAPPANPPPAAPVPDKPPPDANVDETKAWARDWAEANLERLAREAVNTLEGRKAEILRAVREVAGDNLSRGAERRLERAFAELRRRHDGSAREQTTIRAGSTRFADAAAGGETRGVYRYERNEIIVDVGRTMTDVFSTGAHACRYQNCGGSPNVDWFQERIVKTVTHEVAHELLRIFREDVGGLQNEDQWSVEGAQSDDHRVIMEHLNLQCAPNDHACASDCGPTSFVLQRAAACVMDEHSSRPPRDECVAARCFEDDRHPSLPASCIDAADDGRSDACAYVYCSGSSLSGLTRQCCEGVSDDAPSGPRGPVGCGVVDPPPPGCARTPSLPGIPLPPTPVPWPGPAPLPFR